MKETSVNRQLGLQPGHLNGSKHSNNEINPINFNLKL